MQVIDTIKNPSAFYRTWERERHGRRTLTRVELNGRKAMREFEAEVRRAERRKRVLGQRRR